MRSRDLVWPCRSLDDNVVPTLEPAAISRGHAFGWKSARTAPPGSRIGVYVPAGPSAEASRTVAPSSSALLVAASRSSTWMYGNHPKCSPPCGTTVAHGLSPPTSVLLRSRGGAGGKRTSLTAPHARRTARSPRAVESAATAYSFAAARPSGRRRPRTARVPRSSARRTQLMRPARAAAPAHRPRRGRRRARSLRECAAARCSPQRAARPGTARHVWPR